MWCWLLQATRSFLPSIKHRSAVKFAFSTLWVGGHTVSVPHVHVHNRVAHMKNTNANHFAEIFRPTQCGATCQYFGCNGE